MPQASLCTVCSKTSGGGKRGGLLACAGCHQVFYCSKECQSLSWKLGGHRSVCANLSANHGLSSGAPSRARFQKSRKAWTRRLAESNELGQLIAAHLPSAAAAATHVLALFARWDPAAANGAQLVLEDRVCAVSVKEAMGDPCVRDSPDDLASWRIARENVEKITSETHVGVGFVLFHRFEGVKAKMGEEGCGITEHFMFPVDRGLWRFMKEDDPRLCDAKTATPRIVEAINRKYGRDLC